MTRSTHLLHSGPESVPYRRTKFAHAHVAAQRNDAACEDREDGARRESVPEAPIRTRPKPTGFVRSKESLRRLLNNFWGLRIRRAIVPVMASTVDRLFDAAGVVRLGAVPWQFRVPSEAPGVYVVARTPDPALLVSGHAAIDGAAVEQLLDTRAELLMDGQRPSLDALSQRLASMWLPDEPAIYIGRAGTSLEKRVGQFYSTRLGARSPHAGGWPIKCISDLSVTWVHFGECTDVKDAELKMLDAFISAVPPESRAGVLDPELPLPFANLEFVDSAGRRRIKRHGIKGAKAAR